MNRNDELQVVVAGHICLDITPNLSNIEKKGINEVLSPGKLIHISGAEISLGGAVSNTGLAFPILGVNAKLMGKIGNDQFGTVVLDLLEKRNAREGMIVVDGARTSFTIILVPPGTDRIFLHDPGANDTFSAEDINYEVIEQARLFHFGYPPIMKKIHENDGRDLVEIFKRVKKMNVTTSLDMCLPDPNSPSGKVDWEKVLTGVLPYVDIYVPSIEETLYMIDRNEYNRLNENFKGRDIIEVMDLNKLPELGKKLLDLGAKVVVIKCGKKGYYIRTRSKKDLDTMGKALKIDTSNWADRELMEETYNVPKVLSTTGAGDTSIAGFLAAFLNGLSIEESVKIACAVGSECVQTYDAISGIKSLDETIGLIRSGWKKDRISIEGSYWKYDSDRSTWIGKSDSSL